MKVPVQSPMTRQRQRSFTACAAVAASLLSVASGCGSSSDSNVAPFTMAPTAGSVSVAPTSAAGATAAKPAASTPATSAAGTAAPSAAAAGSAATASAAGAVATAPAGAGSGASASAGSSAAPAAAGMSGGAAGGGAAAGGSATFTAVLAILADTKNNCGLCHKTMTNGGGLVFDVTDKAGTFAALVGAASKGMNGSTCGGKTYVVPGKPDESLLYDKVSKAMPSCGLRMPASGVVLDDPEIATIKAWIMGGALNN